MIKSYKLGEELLEQVSRLPFRPSLLLHACCGPCSTYPLQLLNKIFNITVYYNNSNIYPLEEYEKRFINLKKYIDILNKQSENEIKLIKCPYTGEEYSQKLEKRGFDREGGLRCRYCITLRMKDAFHYAFINHFDYFTSTMSMSRQKDEQMVNQIGLSFQTKYPWTKFIVHNFKKKGGQELGLALTKKYDLYQQLFCGCKFSRKT